eukprot:2719667-Rhodomonas_salina.1
MAWHSPGRGTTYLSTGLGVSHGSSYYVLGTTIRTGKVGSKRLVFQCQKSRRGKETCVLRR